MKTLSPPVWRAVTLLTAAAVLALALTPAPPAALDTGWDKANHVLAFLTLGVTARLGWRSPRRWLWLLALGVAIEGLQALTPTREASGADVLADVVGLALAGALVWPFRPRARA